MHNNSYSKFGDDFPIAALTVKQFKELYFSLNLKSRPAAFGLFQGLDLQVHASTAHPVS